MEMNYKTNQEARRYHIRRRKVPLREIYFAVSGAFLIVHDDETGWLSVGHVRTNPDGYQSHYKGIVRTPWVGARTGHRKTRLVAPFCD
jgi:hypothetical protein